MKGILLAGGKGTRLFPSSKSVSKHLFPVYDKPMIYYPLSTLMLAEIQEILIISDENSLPLLKKLLGDGSQWGLSLAYETQHSPNGIAEALLIAEKFLSGSPASLILGDNIFYGAGFYDILIKAKKLKKGANIFAYSVSDPSSFGVIELDKNVKPISLEEKPLEPKSKFAVPGLYFYDNQAVEIAKSINPSGNGELEISFVNQIYLERNQLEVEILGRGMAWLDAGTAENLLAASQFVQTIEQRQGWKIAVPEEIAWRLGWINSQHLLHLSDEMKNTYGDYLRNLVIS